MRSHLRWFSPLVYLLVFYLIQPNCWGASRSDLPNASPSNPKKIKVAVVELQDSRVKQESVEKVTDTLRDELKRNDKLEVISKERTYQFFSASPNLRNPGNHTSSLNRYLAQAKEFYKNFQFKDAVRLLENTISTYRDSKLSLGDNFLLTDAYLMLGNIHMGNNDPRHAQEAFKEAVRLDPSREITEVEYPPRTVAMFRKSKEEFLKKNKSVELEVSSSPNKADVYLNGVLKGKTPLKLDRMTQGEHFILVQHEGYKTQAKRVLIKTSEAREKISLEKSSTLVANPHGLTVTNLQDVPEQVALATAVGKGMNVDKVVLTSVEEIGWNNKITARMIDIRYQASHKHKSVEVLDLPKDTRSAAHVIAADLGNIADIDLAKDPKKYAESEILVIGNKKKRPLIKSPILWGLIGVAVAGGATGALLLGGGGGGGGGGNTSTVSLSGSPSATP